MAPPTETAHESLLIIPALNEARSIARVVQAVRDTGAPVDVLVIDDGSRDETAAIARAFDLGGGSSHEA